MPRGDGTGPIGMGPMTGRRMGYCVDRTMPASEIRGYGRGMGRGRGFRGRYRTTDMAGCMRLGAYPYDAAPFAGRMSTTDKKEFLQQQADLFEKQLNQIREQLNTIEENE